MISYFLLFRYTAIFLLLGINTWISRKSYFDINHIYKQSTDNNTLNISKHKQYIDHTVLFKYERYKYLINHIIYVCNGYLYT